MRSNGLEEDYRHAGTEKLRKAMSRRAASDVCNVRAVVGMAQQAIVIFVGLGLQPEHGP